ncbi:NUDIX domain-containing protein [Streptomyces sp. TRM66268-LWL]|uniref:NUDIX domain-containing protein n=1 Tax=Streptomyces polyasparticus TaxID=2767826 RepID=A0ABR7SM24_9ACTN|nr:NUDIX domain-containing protein [Streptomyces polyasparticus]MBC9716042.1 NUDIX domain-containing protein [Streptomyces polyasparticus]
MTNKRSAGLLLHRSTAGRTEVLLGHMGGPFWARRDDGAWSIPKGEYEPDEAPMDAARREFEEELGVPPPTGPYEPLGETQQPNGKVVTVWAVGADLDPDRIVPGTFSMEWPKGSGRMQEFPEIDKVAWWSLDEAEAKLVKGQVVFLTRLQELLSR